MKTILYLYLHLFFFFFLHNLDHLHININAVKIAKKAIELIDPKISEKNIFNSIRNTKIQGRCDLINNEFLVDVAHNEDAIKNLKSFIKSRSLDEDGIEIGTKKFGKKFNPTPKEKKSWEGIYMEHDLYSFLKIKKTTL